MALIIGIAWTSRRKLSPSGIETATHFQANHAHATSRRKLSPSGIETVGNGLLVQCTRPLRGGNYPHRGLKPYRKPCGGVMSNLRGGNYPHRGLKRSCFVARVRNIYTSRRKLSPSGIETGLHHAASCAGCRLRGGNYPHRGLKPSDLFLNRTIASTSRRKLSPSGIETFQDSSGRRQSCFFAEETIPIGD